ncbi:MAG TPA: single-stranded-DNA-specific exonuclease RecJ, partial [Candidatus Obscuribacterales bacterium]
MPLPSWPDLHVHSLSAETALLAQTLGVSPVLAQLLINRGIGGDEARTMLAPRPELSWPEPAFAEELRERFQELARNFSAIAIFGDYDADGLSGTAVLSTFLRGAGFRVTGLLPTRSQGYGLNCESIRQLAEEGHALLITVDCGISNAVEIAYARSLGMEVVITDHHGLPETLPETDYILHPAVLGIPELSNLSGAGMAWWLSALLHPAFELAPSPESLLDLAVLGTLADMTPLRGLNFAVAKRGLKAARATRRPGLLALARLKGLNLAELTEEDLTFRLIPMLNAAGRIDSPRPALELLLSQDETQSRVLAQELQDMNSRRQKLCQEVLADALERLSQAPERPVIVLASPDWLHGVLGITCSQLVERFHKPVVLMAIEGEQAKASVRVPKGYNVLEALQSCDNLLVRYGGHEMAGGFTIACRQIPAFADRFEQTCLSQQDQVHKRLNVEMELNPELLKLELLQELRQLAPFGMGNPPPLFLSLNVTLEDIKSDRKSNSHFFARVGKGIRLKGWQMWDDELPQHERFDMVYSLEQSCWRDQVQLELTLQALRPHPRGQIRLQEPGSEAEAPAALAALADSAAEDNLPRLPGWFFDGEDYWTLPRASLYAEPVWEDRRQQPPLAAGYGRVLYLIEHPPGARIQAGRAGQFQTLLLDQPPPAEAWPELGEGFAQIALLPLKPLPEPPRFQELWPILAFLQEQDLPLQHAEDLARRFALPLQRAELCLSSLCDLGLLAYDKERYRIQYKNQLY